MDKNQKGDEVSLHGQITGNRFGVRVGMFDHFDSSVVCSIRLNEDIYHFTVVLNLNLLKETHVFVLLHCFPFLSGLPFVNTYRVEDEKTDFILWIVQCQNRVEKLFQEWCWFNNGYGDCDFWHIFGFLWMFQGHDY